MSILARGSNKYVSLSSFLFSSSELFFYSCNVALRDIHPSVIFARIILFSDFQHRIGEAVTAKSRVLVKVRHTLIYTARLDTRGQILPFRLLLFPYIVSLNQGRILEDARCI